MLSPIIPTYADQPPRLAALDAAEGAAYLRHASPSRAVGSEVAFLKLFAQRYEARAALAEQNYAFANTLLPAGGQLPALGVGLPLVPAGVLVQVDTPAAPQVTVTFNVGGPVAVAVKAPDGTTPAAPALNGATQSSATFAAYQDGVYALRLSAHGVSLGTVYVVVSRKAFSLFREDSRALAFGFRIATPRPGDHYLERLACLAFAEAAAQTGDATLAARLLTAAEQVEGVARPVGLYPYTPNA